MKDHLKTIREALDGCRSAINRRVWPELHGSIEEALTALDALEAAMREPVAWIEHYQGSIAYNPYPDAARQLPDGIRFDLYTAAPPAQQAQPSEIDWSQAGPLMEAAASAKHAGFTTGTTNWAAHVYRQMLKSTGKQAQAEAVQLVDPDLKAAANHTWQQANAAEQAEAVPITEATLRGWKDRVNTLASCSTKADRVRVGSALKQDIADAITAAPKHDEAVPHELLAKARYALIMLVDLTSAEAWKKELFDKTMNELSPAQQAQAEAVPEDVVRDAERYRWLRDNWFTMSAEYDLVTGIKFTTGRVRWSTLTEAKLDATIDAAIAAAPQPKE